MLHVCLIIFNDSAAKRIVESPRSFESVISHSVQNFPDKRLWSIGQFPRALFFLFVCARNRLGNRFRFVLSHMKIHHVENAPGGFANNGSETESANSD